jgi:hypothetical protein
MGQAAIYSLEHYRQTVQKELFREECHRQLDLFLDALEPQMSKSNPTLEELTTAIFSQRNNLMGQFTTVLVKQTHADLIEQEYRPQEATRPPCALEGPVAGSQRLSLILGRWRTHCPYRQLAPNSNQRGVG